MKQVTEERNVSVCVCTRVFSPYSFIPSPSISAPTLTPITDPDLPSPLSPPPSYPTPSSNAFLSILLSSPKTLTLQD